ncbi:MAG: hypothetical protein ABR95_05675 [Sphingobacteriales bacterium BACL12 MAG-120813-bin55]|nr:MAG: hypothetical protein ABR94_02540 [Sphingobacteriales bacterium BACL12 MAG-120802-bin5]KRP12042.1 MAG: hypothetical protein ABR95_05675 [Sphingobacteriales bacterium BACL12 MAG-120813-bin55]
MNKLKHLLLVSLIIPFMMSCSSKRSPEATVEAFVEAVNSRNWDEAKALSSEESAATINILSGFGSEGDGEVISIDINEEATKITGDTAAVSGKDQNNMEMVYELIMEDGQWKVHVSMDKMFGGSMEK